MHLHPVSNNQIQKRPLASASSPRRAFPAWIDSGQGPSFAAIVTPRVRDSLVLRLVAQAKHGLGRHVSHAQRAH